MDKQNILFKDLSLILKEIKYKKDELLRLDNLIKKRYDDYAELSLKEKPLQDALLSRKIDLQEVIQSLEVQIPGLKDNIELFKVQTVKQSKDIENIKKIKVEIEDSIKNLESKKVRLELDIQTRQSTLSSVNAGIVKKDLELTDLGNALQHRLNSLNNLDKIIESKKEDNLRLDEDMLNKTRFLHDIQDYVEELQYREDVVKIMEKRLTPEYKQTFKRFANIK